MTVYSMILFAVAALCLGFGIAINRGKTELIHDYHQKKVPEEKRLEYGRAFSAGMFVLAGALFLSGAIGLMGDSRPFVIASLAVLFAGIAVSLAMIARVQKKYNGGLF
ncbi:MAG: hypothetical protein IIT70_06190 [Clostridia bacterium]|nr:hypothetical protein [Clostridia bacterium]MBQ3937860.1 hypothetical protein [Clostridia bacterium]MBQ5488424.1 hypothetical protein [Clostridia bacterium]